MHLTICRLEIHPRSFNLAGYILSLKVISLAGTTVFGSLEALPSMAIGNCDCQSAAALLPNCSLDIGDKNGKEP